MWVAISAQFLHARCNCGVQDSKYFSCNVAVLFWVALLSRSRCPLEERPKARVHRCPRCKSLAIRRTLRDGFVEQMLLRLLKLAPYRCNDCEKRFFDFKATPQAPQSMTNY